MILSRRVHILKCGETILDFSLSALLDRGASSYAYGKYFTMLPPLDENGSAQACHMFTSLSGNCCV